MNINIGENIRRLRLEKHITQELLSEAMGVSCAAVSKWERSDTLPDILLLPLPAHCFSVAHRLEFNRFADAVIRLE